MSELDALATPYGKLARNLVGDDYVIKATDWHAVLQRLREGERDNKWNVQRANAAVERFGAAEPRIAQLERELREIAEHCAPVQTTLAAWVELKARRALAIVQT